jgi:hypothetical protein
MSAQTPDRSTIEARFAEVFAHLGLIAAYARRRGARDPDGIAAEAWRSPGGGSLMCRSTTPDHG